MHMISLIFISKETKAERLIKSSRSRSQRQARAGRRRRSSFTESRIRVWSTGAQWSWAVRCCCCGETASLQRPLGQPVPGEPDAVAVAPHPCWLRFVFKRVESIPLPNKSLGADDLLLWTPASCRTRRESEDGIWSSSALFPFFVVLLKNYLFLIGG